MGKLLVTGGAGFIGCNFVRRYLREHPQEQLVNLDKMTYAGRKENLQDIEGNPNYSFIQGDICNPGDVEKAMQGCNAVVNFAAESHVDRSIEDSQAFLQSNFVGVKVLLDQARKQEVEKFVQISSVTGDTPLLVKGIKSKTTELIPIEKLENKKLSELEVLTLNEDYKVVFKKMTRFIKHPVREVYKIYYRGGGLVRATESHSLFVFEDENIVAKATKELKEGDKLVTFLGDVNQETKKAHNFDLREILKDYTTKQIEQGIKIRKHILEALREAPQKGVQLEKKIGKNVFSTIKHLLENKFIRKAGGLYFIEHKGVNELEKGMQNLWWLLVKNKLHVKKEKIATTPELMKIFGYYLAEGHSAHTKKELEWNSNQVIFTFSLKEGKIVKEIEEFFKKEFGIGVYISKRKESIQISLNSEITHRIFRMFGSTAYTKKIPCWVWSQPKNLVRSLIKGYECDAAIKKDGRRHFTSVNKKLVTALVWLMRYNDINCSYLERTVKNNNPPHAIEVKDLNCYDILVSAENEFEEEVSAIWRSPMARCLPPETLREDRNSKMFGELYLDKRKLLSKSRIKKIYESQRPFISKDKLCLVYSDIGVAKIKKIEKEKGEFMVYDVSVPGNEKFFGGNTPILLHNTDEVYGQIPTGSSKEEDVLQPRNPYSAAKASGELLAMSYFTTYDFPVLVTRSSNNYGPYQYPEKVIPLFITNLLRGKKVPLYGEGKNIRDWLYVDDNCAAIDLVLQKGKAGEIYNIGGNEELQNIELTKRILKELGKGEEMIEKVQDRLGHDLRYSLDCSKIERELGWKAEKSFEQGLQETVQWYKDNEDWWKGLVK